jgi:hypothetical protein
MQQEKIPTIIIVGAGLGRPSPYKKYVYGKNTFCIHFMYVSIDSVYKIRIFNKQFIFEHFLKKLMYTKCIRKKLIMRNVYGIFKL